MPHALPSSPRPAIPSMWGSGVEWWGELNAYLMAGYGYGYTPYTSAVSSYAPPNIVAKEVPLPVDETESEGYFDEAGNWVPFVLGPPEFEPGSIFAPGEIWGSPPARGYEETGDTADDVLNESGEEVVADWGDYIGAAIDIYRGTQVEPISFAGGGSYGGGGASAPIAGPPVVAGVPCVTTPGGKYYNAALGKWCYKSPRRRRKRLLTNGDFNDLMRIATLPNNAMTKIALAKAVGR